MDYQPLAVMAATGNERARRALWEKLHASRKLEGWARSWFRCRDDAEDAASEALLRAMEGFAGFRSRRGHFLGWVYRIAGNEFSRYLSQRVKKHAHTPLAGDDRYAAPDWTSDAIIDESVRAGLWSLLSTSAAELSPRQRNVAWKLGVERMGYRDVAEELGISYEYCRQEYSRAKKKLRRVFSKAALQAQLGG
jgi:RNA polymerase sigma factor (sigma-70 family)